MSSSAGMPVRPAANRPGASSRPRNGSTANRAGSRVESAPAATSESTAHERVIAVKSGTVRASIRSGRADRRTRPGPRIARIPSAPTMPRMEETRWIVLRCMAVRHIARRSRTTVETVPRTPTGPTTGTTTSATPVAMVSRAR